MNRIWYFIAQEAFNFVISIGCRLRRNEMMLRIRIPFWKRICRWKVSINVTSVWVTILFIWYGITSTWCFVWAFKFAFIRVWFILEVSIYTTRLVPNVTSVRSAPSIANVSKFFCNFCNLLVDVIISAMVDYGYSFVVKIN